MNLADPSGAVPVVAWLIIALIGLAVPAEAPTVYGPSELTPEERGASSLQGSIALIDVISDLSVVGKGKLFIRGLARYAGKCGRRGGTPHRDKVLERQQTYDKDQYRHIAGGSKPEKRLTVDPVTKK